VVAGLGTVLDRLQGWFGKGYLLAGFMPVLSAGVLMLLFAAALFPEVLYAGWRIHELSVTDQVLVGLLVAMSVALVGLFYWGLSPWMLRFLQGQGNPFAPLLRRGQERECRALDQAIQSLDLEELSYAKNIEAWRQRLRVARLAGNQLAAGPADAPDKVAVLQARYDRLARLASANQSVAVDDLGALIEDVRQLLEVTPVRTLTDLAHLHRRLVEELIPAARTQVERRRGQLWADRRLRFPGDAGRVQPTRLGNVAAVLREDAWARYGIDLEVFWPHLQKVSRADPALHALLDATKLNLDVAVSLVFTFGLLSAGAFALAFAGGAHWLLGTAVVAGCGLVAVAFYRVSVETYHAYASLLRAVTDLYRLDLLKVLHVELPRDTDAERALWRQLVQAALYQQGQRLELVYPAERPAPAVAPPGPGVPGHE
jgi:hypothetical protein